MSGFYLSGALYYGVQGDKGYTQSSENNINCLTSMCQTGIAARYFLASPQCYRDQVRVT